jgi:hypothetical protein
MLAIFPAYKSSPRVCLRFPALRFLPERALPLRARLPVAPLVSIRFHSFPKSSGTSAWLCSCVVSAFRSVHLLYCGISAGVTGISVDGLSRRPRRRLLILPTFLAGKLSLLDPMAPPNSKPTWLLDFLDAVPKDVISLT